MTRNANFHPYIIITSHDKLVQIKLKNYILFWVNFIEVCGAVGGQSTDCGFLFHHWREVTHSCVIYMDYSHAGHFHILVDHEHHVTVFVFTANDCQQCV